MISTENEQTKLKNEYGDWKAPSSSYQPLFFSSSYYFSEKRMVTTVSRKFQIFDLLIEELACNNPRNWAAHTVYAHVKNQRQNGTV